MSAPSSSSREARPAKIRRVLGSSLVPHRELAALLAALKKEGDVDDLLNVDRKALDRAVDGLWKDVGQVEALPTGLGKSFAWSTVSLPKMLRQIVETSPAWARELRQAYDKKPCTSADPFHLLVYADEYVPGSVLKLDNRRKVLAVYATVQEFRREALKHDHMWLVLGLIRSSEASKLNGGAAAAVARLYKRWFLEEQLSERGVLLDLDAPNRRFANIYLKPGVLITDGEALRAIWSAKGASGKLPCLLCKNLVHDPDAAARSDYLVDLGDPEGEFDLASDADLWEKADTLQSQAAVLSKTAFERLQLLQGLTYNPRSLLWELDLRPLLPPSRAFRYDSMHVLLSNGVAQQETSLLLGAMREHHVGFEELRALAAADWHSCRIASGRAVLRDVFAAPREKAFKKEGVLKTSASEMLVALPFLVFFCETVLAPRGLCTQEIASAQALADVLRSIRSAKDGRGRAADMDAAVRRHAAAFNAAYGVAVKPKHHYLRHLAEQFRKDGVVLDAFVGERKHILIKKCAECVTNTARFERTVLMRCVSKQLADTADASFFADGLLSPQSGDHLAGSLGVASARFSKTMKFNGTTLGAEDAIMWDNRIHIVMGCADLDGVLCVMARRYDFVAKVTSGASRWQRAPGDALFVLPLEQAPLFFVDLWFQEPGDAVVVLC